MTNTNTNSEKEIDLTEILIKVYTFFSKYKYIFIGAIALGILLSIMKFSIEKKYYKSDIIVLSNQKEILINMLESLIEQDDYSILADNFGLSKKANKCKVTDMSVERIFIGEGTDKTEQAMFKVYFSVTDTAMFKNLEKGIVYFAENNDFIKQENEFNKIQNSELIKKYKEEIDKIDSLRNINFNNKLTISGSDDNKNEIINLYRQQQSIERSLKLSKPVRIVRHFDLPKKAFSTKIKTGIISVFLSFFIALIITLLIETNRFVRRHEKNKVEETQE